MDRQSLGESRIVRRRMERPKERKESRTLIVFNLGVQCYILGMDDSMSMWCGCTHDFCGQ